ncbi:MAG: hypothetical protein DA330_02070 [Nitrososphaera sp.]|nr:hypothetical protein [Nitrososphaera sp.]
MQPGAVVLVSGTVESPPGVSRQEQAAKERGHVGRQNQLNNKHLQTTARRDLSSSRNYSAKYEDKQAHIQMPGRPEALKNSPERKL